MAIMIKYIENGDHRALSHRLGGRNDNYSTCKVSLGTLVTIAHIAGVKTGGGRGGKAHMEGGGLGERKNACYKNPLVFISAFAENAKFLLTNS